MARLLAAVVGVALLAVALTTAAAVVLTVATVYGALWIARWLWRDNRARVAQVEHQRAELIARADIQHRWVLANDPRGTYGRYQPVLIR